MAAESSTQSSMSRSDLDLAPRTIVDRYRIERLLGRGGMASVYRVRHLELGSLHALKVVDTPNDQMRKRLVQEGRVQARLSHPNVVRVTDVVRVGGRPGLVLEYVAGPTLGELLRDRKLTLEQVDHIVVGILRGVEVAHGLGFAHRDLKPGNILLAHTPDGVVPKVADFGLAKVLEGTGLDSTR
ncbi:MAG: serine/threonine protein kinase, partial [Myxococcales bacterium]|nr:serine/threonine protein kinase [Myxococcales bacterium]